MFLKSGLDVDISTFTMDTPRCPGTFRVSNAMLLLGLLVEERKR